VFSPRVPFFFVVLSSRLLVPARHAIWRGFFFWFSFRTHFSISFCPDLSFFFPCRSFLVSLNPRAVFSGHRIFFRLFPRFVWIDSPPLTNMRFFLAQLRPPPWPIRRYALAPRIRYLLIVSVLVSRSSAVRIDTVFFPFLYLLVFPFRSFSIPEIPGRGQLVPAFLCLPPRQHRPRCVLRAVPKEQRCHSPLPPFPPLNPFLLRRHASAIPA